jgi:hypothetical protein
MYNLPYDANEADFLKWRLGDHQRHNAGLEGMTRTDFGGIVKAWPDQAVPRFRFVTTVEWPNMKAFERGFYAADVQTGLLENVKRLGDYEYSICEILVSSDDHQG